MLKFFRHRGTQKKIYIVLAVVVVLSFVVSGVIISKDDKATLSALGKIGGHKISVQEYLDSYRAVQNQAAWMYGDKLAEIRDRINFKGEAWDRLLLLDYAKKQAIRASDSDVVKWITSQTAFQKDGKFDDKFYQMYIERALRSTPRNFEEEIRQMLTIQKVQDKFKTEGPLTDEQLKERYIKQRSEKNLLYTILPWENFQSEVPVADKDIEELYALVKDKLTAPEKVKLSYISIPKESLESMKAALEQKDMGIDALSKTYKLEVQTTKPFSKNDSVAGISSIPQALDAAFTLEPGKESDWIHHPQGAVKVRVDSKEPEHPMSLQESKEELLKQFKRQKATELAVNRLRSLKDKLKTGDFEATLKAENLEVTPLEKYRQGMYPAGIYPSENLQKAVESMKDGDISEAFEVPKGAMLVKVTKTMPIDEKKFQEEKEDFRRQVESENVDKGIQDLLGKLRKDLEMNLERMKEIFPSDSPTTS